MAATGNALPRASVEAIVQNWATELNTKNAPDPKHKGPLAWVRDEKVAELIAALGKAGYK